MECLAEIIANILLIFGFFIVRWCSQNKHATFAIFVILLMIVDVIFLLWRFGIIQV